MSILSDDPGTTNRANLVQQVKATSDAGDAQIKAFLGDDKFAQLQTYEKSIGERMAVGDFKDQLGTGPNALNDAQEQQLIQVMTEERQNSKFTTDFSDESKFTDEFVSLVTEDKMKGYLQELSQLDQQYLMRARGILSPDQLAEFEKYLNTQQRLQTAGMQITVKLGDH